MNNEHTVKRSNFVRICGIALIIGISLILLIGFGRNSSTTKRLADGSWLKIVAVSYGESHSFRLPRPKPWHRFLVENLPISISAMLDLGHVSGGILRPGRPGETNLAIFTICKQTTPTSLRSSPKMEVFNDVGVKVGTASGEIGVGDTQGKHPRWLVCWTVDSRIPVDSRKLVLRFSELISGGKERHEVAEFVISNPGVADIPRD